MNNMKQTIGKTSSVAAKTGALLKQYRNEKGLNMRVVGERLGVPHSFVGKIENAERRLDILEFIHYCRVGLGLMPLQIFTEIAELYDQRGD